VNGRWRGFLHQNGLSIGFGVIFLAALAGQAVAGHADFNSDQVLHGGGEVSLGRYLTSSHFASAVMENWQSEYLQFTLFILATIWLLQRGSPESKEPSKQGRESESDQLLREHAESGSPGWARAGGLRTFVYSNSLLLVMGAIWITSWLAQSVTGRIEYNAELLSHRVDPISWTAYLGTAEFWEKTLQNWQSEFLAVGSMAILAVYLRQRGSPESKPVGSPHHVTGRGG
jgi:uncharacterized protein DUF6766